MIEKSAETSLYEWWHERHLKFGFFKRKSDGVNSCYVIGDLYNNIQRSLGLLERNNWEVFNKIAEEYFTLK